MKHTGLGIVIGLLCLCFFLKADAAKYRIYRRTIRYISDSPTGSSLGRDLLGETHIRVNGGNALVVEESVIPVRPLAMNFISPTHWPFTPIGDPEKDSWKEFTVKGYEVGRFQSASLVLKSLFPVGRNRKLSLPDEENGTGKTLLQLLFNKARVLKLMDDPKDREAIMEKYRPAKVTFDH